MKNIARKVKNDPDYLPPEKFIGALPHEFTKHIPKDKIAEATLAFQEILFEFAKKMQSIQAEFGKDLDPETHKNIVLEIQQQLRNVIGLPELFVEFIGGGEMGKVYKIQNGTNHNKYALKIFNNTDIIRDGANRARAHHDRELKNMLVAYKYDQSRRAPRVFTGKFGRSGFILAKFIDDENSLKVQGSLSKDISMFVSGDGLNESNSKNDTLLDWGGSFRSKFSNNKLLKIARKIANALDQDNANIAKMCYSSYGKEPEFQTALEQIINGYGFFNDFVDGRFSAKTIRELGADKLVLDRLVGTTHNFFSSLKGYYSPIIITEYWYKKVQNDPYQDINALNRVISDSLRHGVTEAELKKIGIADLEIKEAIKENFNLPQKVSHQIKTQIQHCKEKIQSLLDK